MGKQQRNGKIELLRFFFSIAVLCFHIQKYILGELSPKDGIRFGLFPSGSMSVEFFFIVSGFFMAASLYHSKNQQKTISLGSETLHFIKNKFLSLLPMRAIVFVLLFAITLLSSSWSFGTLVKKVLSYIPGFFLVQMSGIGVPYLNHIEWYLSVMLIGMFILYPLLRKNFDTFSKIVAPLVTVLVLGYMYQSFGRLTEVKGWDVVCYRSLLRGIAELCLGVFIFVICGHLQKVTLSGFKKLAFTCFEVACWIAAFTMMMLTLPRNYEFYMLIFIAMGATCSFSNLSWGTRLFNNRACFYLGKLSLPIYLCQLIPITLVTNHLEFLPGQQQVLVCLASTVVLSVVIFHVSKALSRFLPK